MISTQHSPTGLRIIPGQTGVTVYSPYLPIWFDRFNAVEEPDPDLKVDPSDINYPSELRCPNCDQLSFDSICRCGAMIQHPDSGDFSCN